MGRLDDAAKRKVVELREAGLSFRKIKAVLELENIKVSAQAIYLFLKEFQGRSRQNDLSVSGNSGLSAVGSGSREMGLSEPKQGGWNEQQLRNLLREASSHAAGFTSSPDTLGQSGVASEPRGQSSGTGATSQERRQNDKKDEDVRIVSVTSLAQSSHHASIQTARSGAIAGTLARKRYTPSPANPVLVARKRLLDKALFHRARVRDSCPQSGQQTVSLLRRDQSTFLFSEGRKVMLPQTTSCTPTTTRPPHVRGQHPGTNLVRQGFQQRANLYSRSADQPQRVGIRLPAPGQSGAGGQAAGSTIRPRAPTGQPSPPCQQSCMDTGTLGSLQEHVKTLASEVRSISLALRMMVEQQGHLKREQSLQTQVQKQILSTLQKLTTQLEPTALHHCTTSTATSCPMSSASYNQSAMVTSQGGALCSQAQSRYNDINGAALDSIGPFSLDSLSSGAVTTFQSPESLPFTHIHTPPFTQSHTQAYTPEMLSYTQPQTDACPGMDSKPVEISSPNSNSSFQSCRSQGPCSTEPAPVGDAPLTIVKVESI